MCLLRSTAPKLNVLLDLEPIRPGEGEAEAARRLLGRIRRVYGVRFLDAVTVDSWYVQAPLLEAVEKLGWAWLGLLKQERMDVFQEARAWSAGQAPTLKFEDKTRHRRVKLWEVKDLDLSESYGRKVLVVHAEEAWIDTKVVGGKKDQPAADQPLVVDGVGGAAGLCVPSRLRRQDPALGNRKQSAQ
jgi:hypothetical protein